MSKNHSIALAVVCIAGYALFSSAAPIQDTDGTYLIATAEDLSWLGSNPTVSARLTANITLNGVFTTAIVNTAANENAFPGSLVGERNADGTPRYTITLAENASITTGSFPGIFQRLTGTVKDIALDIKGTITGTGTTQTGALAGSIQAEALVENVWVKVSGSVTGGNNVGGLSGNSFGANITVKGCVVEISGSLTSTGGDSRVGGLMGGPNLTATSSITDNVVILRSTAVLRTTVAGDTGYSGVGGLFAAINNNVGSYINNTVLIEPGATLEHTVATPRVAGVIRISNSNRRPTIAALAGCRLIKDTSVELGAFDTDVAGYTLTTCTFDETTPKDFSVTRQDSPFTPAAVTLQEPLLLDAPVGWGLTLNVEDPTCLKVTGPASEIVLRATVPYYLREADLETGITAVSGSGTFQFAIPLPALRWSGTESMNWSPGSWAIIEAPACYTDGSNVAFGDLSDVSALTITASGEEPGSILVDNNATAYTFNGTTSGISGTTGLTKRGLGALTFTGEHTFSGGILMENGTLNLTGQLGASGIHATGGALAVTAPGSAATLTLTAITGTAPLTKTGPGMLFLAGENTYTDKTVISGGQLHITGSYSVPQKVSGAPHIRVAAGTRIGGSPGARIVFESSSSSTSSLENEHDIFLAAGGGTTLAGGGLVIPPSGTFFIQAGVLVWKNIGLYLTQQGAMDTGRIRIKGHFYWPGAAIDAAAVDPADVPVCLLIPSASYARNRYVPFLTISSSGDNTGSGMTPITPETLMTKLRIRMAEAPDVDLKQWTVEQRTEIEEGETVHNYYLIGPPGLSIVLY